MGLNPILDQNLFPKIIGKILLAVCLTSVLDQITTSLVTDIKLLALSPSPLYAKLEGVATESTMQGCH